MNTSTIKYGVFIPTYNAVIKDLKPFKNNLEVLKKLPENYKILFIDSSSKDNTVDIIKQYGFECKIIVQSEFDHGQTRQFAAEMLADCEVVIYLTQDAELLGVQSVYNLLKVFDDRNIGVAFGQQLPHHDADFFARENRAFNYPAKSYIRSYQDRAVYGVKCAFCSDSFAAYRIQALQQVGGFPKRVIVSEDMFVAAKMLKADYKVAYVAEAQCYHSHNYSIAQEFRRYFDTGVFFACETWIKQEFGSAENEGKKAVLQLAQNTMKTKPWLLPNFCIRVFVRIVSFKLGVNYKKLPSWLVYFLSSQKQFWRNSQ